MAEADKDTGDGGNTAIMTIIVAVVIGFAALPVVALMFVFGALYRRWQPAIGLLALAGVLFFGLIALEPLKVEWAATKQVIRSKTLKVGPKLERVAGHAPQFWLLTLCLAPVAGVVWETFRPRSLDEKLAEAEERQEQRQSRKERQGWAKAERAQQKLAAGPVVATIKQLKHPLPDFVRQGDALYLNTEGGVANLHILILGGSGSGKTETIKRLVASYAEHTDYDLFLIDPKADPELRFAFGQLVGAHGRSCRLYPHEPYNGFRGDARALHNRFLTIPALGTEGASAYYAELAEEYLWLAINAGESLPRSFSELEERLDYDHLEAWYANDPGRRRSLERIQRRDAHSITMRFANIARKLDTFSADGWAFEDARAGYFALPVLETPRDVSAVARYVIEDLKHYFATRKPSSRRTVVFIDEFSALGSENVVSLMELVRSLGGIMVLASQTVEALGNEALQKRILGNVSLIMQRMNDPREVTALGGMRRRLEVNQRIGGSTPQREITARSVETPLIEPTRVMQLSTGGAFLINRGRVAEVKVVQAVEPDWDLVEERTKLRLMEAAGIIRRAKPVAPAVRRPAVSVVADAAGGNAASLVTKGVSQVQAKQVGMTIDGEDDFI